MWLALLVGLHCARAEIITYSEAFHGRFAHQGDKYNGDCDENSMSCVSSNEIIAMKGGVREGMALLI